MIHASVEVFVRFAVEFCDELCIAGFYLGDIDEVCADEFYAGFDSMLHTTRFETT